MHRLHIRYPLIWGGSFFFAGQIIAAFGYRPHEVVMILVSLCSCSLAILTLSRKWYRFYPLILVTGVLSVWIQSECIAWYEVKDSDRFLLEVVGTPQRPKPNLVKIPVLIREVYFTKESILHLKADALKGKKLLCSAAELPWKNLSGIGEGDIYLADIKILTFSGERSPISYESTLRRRGIAAKCKIKNAVKISEHRATGWYKGLMSWLSTYEGYEMEGGLFASLIFGYRTSLSGILETHFQYAGLSHLLVFSGAQVTIIFLVLNSLLYLLFTSVTYYFRIFKGATLSRVFALVLTFFFVLSIGSDKSTMRALVAASISFTAISLQRNSSIGWGILVSSIILAVIWPGSFMEPGLQLTYAALFGIWLGMKRRSFLWGFLYTSFATSCVSLFWFEAFSIVGFIVNPIVVPVVSFVTTVSGLPSLALALLDLQIGRILIEWNFIFLSWLEEGVYRIAIIPWSYIQLPTISARLFGVAGIIVLVLESRRFFPARANRGRGRLKGV